MKVVLLPAVPFIEASEELHVEFPVPSRLLFEMHISTFTGGVVTHSQPVSIEHCTEHPSPFKVLPSSQISEASMNPSPHSDVTNADTRTVI